MRTNCLQLFTWFLVLSFGAIPVDAQSAAPAEYAGKTAEQWTTLLTEHLGRDTDEDKELCRKAAAALGQLGPAASAAVEPLREALESPKVEVREFAVDALGRIGPPAAPAVPAIVAEMDLAPDHINYALLGKFRRLAAKSLGRIGPEAKEAVPALGKALKNEDPVYRVEAALALWRILEQPRAIDFLASITAATDAEGPYEAVMALGEIGPDASAAMDPLVDALDHPQADVRRAAADVLARLGAEVIEPVAERIRSGSLRDPAPATYVLGEVTGTLRRDVFYQGEVDRATFESAAGPVMRSAAPALVGLLSDSREAVRQSAQQALSQMGLLAVPFLLNLLDEEDAVVRQAALETLVRTESNLPPPGAANEPIKALKQSLLTRLMEQMQHRDSQVRAAAYRTFASMSFQNEGQPALPLLRRALRDENLAVRRYAALAIRQLGGEE